MLVGETNKRNTGVDTTDTDSNVPAAITDTGCERELNEDRYAVIESQSGLAWLVCDGMGGSTGGELAAQLALDAIRRDLEKLPFRPPELALRSALLEANRVIVLRRQNQAFSQMGTTAVAALFSGAEIVVGHVGDSRAYLIRDGAIQQLTTDHTYVQELVDKGQIKPEEALSHAQSHILTRCIGHEPGLEIEMQRYWVWPIEGTEPNDYLLLCTDGLYSHVSEDEIASITSQSSPQRACVQLVELAKSRGGYDNITIAVIPLRGQLKQEPPMGYDQGNAVKQRISATVEKSEPVGLMRTVVQAVVISLLVAILVVLYVIIKSVGA